MYNSSISQYRGTQISSASPEKTVLMLYDGAIRFLKSAITEIQEKNNIPEKAIYIEKTIKIVEYLQSCLDKEKGGEVGTNLDRLYEYAAVKLTEANLKNDTDKMQEVLGILTTIREGWSDICNKNTTGQMNGKPASTTADMAGAAYGEKKIGVKV